MQTAEKQDGTDVKTQSVVQRLGSTRATEIFEGSRAERNQKMVARVSCGNEEERNKYWKTGGNESAGYAGT